MSLSHSFLFYGASFCLRRESKNQNKTPPKTKQNSKTQRPQTWPHFSCRPRGEAQLLLLPPAIPSLCSWLSSKFDASATNSQTQQQHTHRYTHILTQTIPELDNELGQFEGSQQKGDLPLSFAWPKRVVRRAQQKPDTTTNTDADTAADTDTATDIATYTHTSSNADTDTNTDTQLQPRCPHIFC